MSTAVIIAQFAIQFGIPAAQKLVALLNNPNPTQADWDAVWALAAKPYDSYINPPGVQPLNKS